MKIAFQLLDNTKDIEKKILNTLLPQVDSYMSQAFNKIQGPVKDIINTTIKSTPEYDAIVHGKLSYEFGMRDPFSRLDGLIAMWVNNIQFNYTKPMISGNRIKSSININGIKVDFSDVLSSYFAVIEDFERGYSLPWLQWLLLEGNRTIVSNYNVIIGPSKHSRSGFALMKQSTKSWKVPDQYAGTINNNWITRALDSSESQILSVLDGAFQ